MNRAILLCTFLAAITLAGCGGETAPTTPETATPSAPPAPTPPATPSTPSAPSAPADATAPMPTEAAPTAAGQRTLLISPESEISWEMGVTGAAFGFGTRKGGWAVYDGTVELDGQNFETAKINIEVDMTSAYTDDSTLTDKMKGDEHFFQPGKFPKSSFKSTAIKKTDAGYDVTGDFTIRDVTKSVTFPATVTFEGDKLTATATFEMKRQDYNVNYDSAAKDFMIQDNAKMNLVIVAEPE